MNSPAGRLLLRVLGELLRQAPAVMSDPQWRRFVATLYPLVVQARRGSLSAAADVLQREAALHSVELVASVPEPHYELDALDAALTRTVREPLTQSEPREVVQLAAQAAVERHVDMAGREGVRAVAEADSEIKGWARRLTGAENCGFCVMLASRGAVYTSRGSAGGDFRFHDGCDCEIVPVYDVTDWPGLDGFIEANRRYRAALKNVEGRGDNVLKALRRDLYVDPFEIPARAA